MDDFGKDTTDPWYLKDRLPSKWTRLDLQPRDLEFLRILLEQKFLSREQIAHHIFEGKERYAYLRIWKLRRFGFVKRVKGFVNEGLYLPTEQTYDYFKGRFVKVPMPILVPDPRTIFHDLLVTDIRFLFRSIGFGSSWTSERMRRMGRSIRLWAPDAVIQVGGDSFALEVERVQKEDVRYEDIFVRYQDNSEIKASLYVTTDDLFDSLLEKAFSFPNIYFTTISALFNKKVKAVFQNARGNVLAIEDNLECNLKTGNPVNPNGH